jgi:hypothetical protein
MFNCIIAKRAWNNGIIMDLIICETAAISLLKTRRKTMRDR